MENINLTHDQLKWLMYFAASDGDMTHEEKTNMSYRDGKMSQISRLIKTLILNRNFDLIEAIEQNGIWLNSDLHHRIIEQVPDAVSIYTNLQNLMRFALVDSKTLQDRENEFKTFLLERLKGNSVKVPNWNNSSEKTSIELNFTDVQVGDEVTVGGTSRFCTGGDSYDIWDKVVKVSDGKIYIEGYRSLNDFYFAETGQHSTMTYELVRHRKR